MSIYVTVLAKNGYSGQMFNVDLFDRISVRDGQKYLSP